MKVSCERRRPSLLDGRRGGVVRRVPVVVLTAALCVGFALPARAQDVGHKLVGSLGLDAGTQAPPGLYLADRVVYYTASEVRDRDGARVSVEGLEIDALGNALGAMGVVSLPWLGADFSAALGLPLATSRVRSDAPQARIDRFGFGDVAIQPVRLGWRLDRVDVVTGYALYVPTGRFEPRGGGVSSGHVTHQLSVGGNARFAPEQRWFVAAMLSVDMNQPKRGLDVTRGDTLQVQGGVGVRPGRGWELGLATYALWQVEDDRGTELPPALRGARERVVGLGPEVAVRIPAIRAALRLRYGNEFGVASRPDGHIVVLGATFAAVEGRGGESGSGARSQRR